MATYPPARSAEQRKRDVFQRWETDEDAWVSSASGDGTPCLVPLSFVWHGERLLMATKASAGTRGAEARASDRAPSTPPTPAHPRSPTATHPHPPVSGKEHTTGA
ncbi:hypothetical protein [Streptomyces halobius]|uniref:hypothetical protein n=1 Tax=Streptomyces halobius TaxID=2879846 RepID=UPI0038736D49